MQGVETLASVPWTSALHDHIRDSACRVAIQIPRGTVYDYGQTRRKETPCPSFPASPTLRI